jgi:glutamate/tyrosine decarboxylase-like PLP-dependent enzyme
MELLNVTAAIAGSYLERVGGRHVGSRATRAQLMTTLGGPLPEVGQDAIETIRTLAREADPGLVASAGPRYFGFVTGGALPVSIAADWLTSAWDQNGGLYVMSPAVAVMEDVVSDWLLDLIGLPAGASVGLVTGAHMANFTCLAAARHEVLRRVGWNVEEEGLQRAPKLTFFVGGDVHVSVVGGLRMLGMGTREIVRVPADAQGRLISGSLTEAMRSTSGPAVVCAQVGNVSSGASDPIDEIAAIAHDRGAWLHVDGAFGLWAAAVPELRTQVEGLADADSWTTDAHKWLNLPYDSGIAIVKNPAPHRAAMSLHASYLQRGGDMERAGMDWVPESSRRARVIPIYAALRMLGRTGVQEIVRRNCALARRMASRLATEPGVSIRNDVVLNQVLVRFGDDDRMTREVIAHVQADGTCWAGGATWKSAHVMRISISNWSTTEEDVDRSAEAILRAFSSSREALARGDTRA